MKGLIFISTSLFLQAFVLSSVSFSLDKVGVLSFSALSFLLCTIIFFLKVCSAQGLNLDQTKFKAILKLNLYTMLAFFPFHVALFYLAASDASLIEVAIVIFVVSFITKQKKTLLLQSFIIFVFTTFFVFVDQVFSFHILYGFLLASTAGCGAALVSIYSNRDYAGVLSTDEILAFRFILSGIIALCYALVKGQSVVGLLTNYEIIFFAFIGFVIPFYLLQRGMEISEPIIVVCALSIIPLVSYGFESFFYQKPSLLESSLIVVTVVMILNHIFQSFFLQKRNRPALDFTQKNK